MPLEKSQRTTRERASAYDPVRVSQLAQRIFKMDAASLGLGSFRYSTATLWEASTITPTTARGALYLAGWYAGYTAHGQTSPPPSHGSEAENGSRASVDV